MVIGKSFARGMSMSAVMAWALGACGGSTSAPSGGSESHFLAFCESTCGDGLDCISGVCTRGCVVDEGGCEDLSPDATCTDASIEPGLVAVCDVDCSTSADCSALGASHVCDAGFCRQPAGPSPNGCTVGGVEYPNGATRIPSPESCGLCSCEEGQLSCQDVPCGNGNRVSACPDWTKVDIDSDPIEVLGSHFEGDSLILDVAHSGGCEEHTYSVCYESAWQESYPVQVQLVLLHNANGDACNAYLSSTQTFDLTELAEVYKQAYQTDGGLVSTTYGLYAFGALTCEDHEYGVTEQLAQALNQADKACATSADCQVVDMSVSCRGNCPAVVSTQGAATLGTALAAISEHTCALGEGCPQSTPSCAPLTADCVSGGCVGVPGQ